MIYLDNAATTRLAPEVLDAMLPYFTEFYGNASTAYLLGENSRKAVANAREIIADSIGASTDEIYFTSGGSESDNWAIKSVCESLNAKGRHIITSKIEHHAILHTCEYLKKRGYEITYADVDQYGRINMDELKAAIRQDTILISVMFGNNEIGTIEPIEKIGELAHSKGILFHTDAVQAFGQIPINVKDMNIDLLSASGHKFHGPKGIGFLYVKKGINLPSFIHGGAQESGRRAGTENIPGIVGIGAATERAMRIMEEKNRKEIELRNYFIKNILTSISGSHLNGHETFRLPNNANFTFEGVSAESLLIILDMKEICASAGSACTSGSLEPSHVLTAIGLDANEARSTLRFTLSEETSKKDLDYVVEELKKAIGKIKSLQSRFILK